MDVLSGSQQEEACQRTGHFSILRIKEGLEEEGISGMEYSE